MSSFNSDLSKRLQVSFENPASLIGFSEVGRWIFWWGKLAACIEKVTRLLPGRGYSSHPDFDETEYNRMLQKQGQQIELVLITRNSEGKIITPDPFSSWPWPEGSFQAKRFCRLRGVSCPVASPESILDTKEGMRQYMPEKEIRGHDESDLGRLRALIRVDEG